jgi:GNAT superfamily N-acetyltransferase
MKITTFRPQMQEHRGIISMVSRVSETESTLVFRPIRELHEAVIVVAIEEGEDAGQRQIKGFVCLLPFNRRYIELGTLYVAESERGKGLAKSLVEKAIEIAPLDIITRTNVSPLKSYLKRLGFKPVMIKSNLRLTARFTLSRASSLKKFKKFLDTLNRNSCLFILRKQAAQ